MSSVINSLWFADMCYKATSMFYLSHLLATVPEVPGSIPGITRFLSSNGSGQDPLSLVRINEELLEGKGSGSSLENRG
jgi:hypothetical protein